MSGDHNQYQKNLSYLDFECPRCGHCCYVDADDISQDNVDETVKCRQEPVAWMFVNEDGECEQIEYGPVFDDPGVTPLYTAPPQREWVGLTDEDMEALFLNEDGVRFARYIEAKLREKNT